MTTPLEKNARKLIGVVIESFPLGGSTEDLRRQFEAATGLKRQMFYYSLAEAKRLGWLIGGGAQGSLYELNPDASWANPASTGAAQVEQPEEVQIELDTPRISGTNGVAIEHLTEIIANPDATLRQKLRASALLLTYKSDHDTSVFARRFLAKVAARSDTPIDYKLEALEQMRRSQGDPMLRPSIERVAAPSPPRDREAEEAERRIVSERRRKHIEEQAAKDQQRLREEWKQQGWTWPSA
jgi:hypothetical protein